MPILVFTEAGDDLAEPPAVAGAPGRRRAARAAHACARCSTRLRRRGVHGVLCEGGPSLLRRAGRRGPARRPLPHGRAAAGGRRRAEHPRGRRARPDPARLALRDVHRADDHLFLHYGLRAVTRRRASDAPRPRLRPAPGPPAGDGHRQRQPGLVLRRRADDDARRPGRARARQLVADGADLIDVGGESGVTYTGVTAAGGRERARRPARRSAWSPRASSSRSTPGSRVVADAALDAGAHVLNDVSGLRDVGARRRRRARPARRSSSCTRAPRPRRSTSPTTAETSSATSCPSWPSAARSRVARGVPADRLIARPRARTSPSRRPRASRRCARSTALAALGHPWLAAVSRKYFLGRDHRPPAGRAPGGDAGRRRLRRRRTAPRSSGSTTSPPTVDFLRVRGVLAGEAEVPALRRRRRRAEVDPRADARHLGGQQPTADCASVRGH